MKIKFLLFLSIYFTLTNNFSFAQKCMNQQFVSSFVSVESCLVSNSILGCGTAYTIVGGIVGAGASFIGKTYLDRQPRKLPFPITDEIVDSYFKKVPISEQYKLEVVSDQLSDQTIKTLKRKGYKVDEIEKVRRSLNEYRRQLASLQEMMDEDADLERTRDMTKSPKLSQIRLADTIKEITRRMENLGPPSPTDIENMKKGIKAMDQIGDKPFDMEKIKKVLDGLPNTPFVSKPIVADVQTPTSKVSTEMLSIKQPSPMNRTVIRNGLLGAVTGLGVSLGPVIRDEAAVKKCKSDIGFKNEADLKSFREFGTVSSFSSCRTELNPNKVWDLLLMEPGERNSLFAQSPSLCKAFENSFINKANHLGKNKASLNLANTQCGTNMIATEIQVGKRQYPLNLKLQNNSIVIEGSFISGQDLGELPEFEKFSMQLNKDLQWSGVGTTNPNWGFIPGIRENFNSVGMAANPTMFGNFENCEVLEGTKSMDRKMVTHPASSNKLMCAVHQQANAAKAIVPQLLDYCERKSLQNGKEFQNKAQELRVVK